MSDNFESLIGSLPAQTISEPMQPMELHSQFVKSQEYIQEKIQQEIQ